MGPADFCVAQPRGAQGPGRVDVSLACGPRALWGSRLGLDVMAPEPAFRQGRGSWGRVGWTLLPG